MDLDTVLVPAGTAGTLRLPASSEHRRTRLTLDDPAIELMTDLRRVPPISVRSSTSIDEALRGMVLSGVRFLFVVDGAQSLVGSVTASDLQGEKPLLYLRSVDGTLASRTHREIEVGHIMEPVAQWVVVLLPAVNRLRLRHVAAMFQETGRRHLVVVEPELGRRASTVCGLFSATQLERELGLALAELPRAERFVDIQQALGR
jgi:CBS-domain-containing membrane protein